VKKLLIDTDVVLDLLTAREPHLAAAQGLFSELDHGKTQGFFSALTFPNVHYILRREIYNQEAVRALEKLRSMVGILPVDEKIIALALSSRFRDFEDAVQYYTAAQNGMTCLITRNVRDYKGSELPVLTPAEYLSQSRS
jgi:predicted nucleic acid-binding protein